MLNSRAALGCLILSIVLSVACNPRVFFGTGGSAVFSLDGLFFWGQWIAFALALFALCISTMIWLNAGRALTLPTLWIPIFSALMCAYLLLTGVPHPANSGEWRNGELGIAAFMRGGARRAKANAKPIELTAESFRGTWRAPDGTEYTFEPHNLKTRNNSETRNFAGADCAEGFSIRYVQQGREILQDLGLTWSEHAIARYDSTALDAKIPVAEVTCVSQHFVFIRASSNEVWRWTNTLNVNDLKDKSFILTLVDSTSGSR